MAPRYWDGGTSTDPDNVNNWSDTDGGATPASSVPGAADIAYFTASGDGNACTLTVNWTLGEIVVEAGYTSKIDMATFDLTATDASSGTGDMTFDGGGEFDCDAAGANTLSCDRNFDNKDQATWTWGNSTVVMNNTGSLTSHFSNDLFNLTIASGATITTTSGTNFRLDIRGVMDVIGDLIIDTVPIRTTGTLSSITVQSGATISALNSGYIELFAGSGQGITQQDGAITASVLLVSFVSGAILAAGTYAGAVTQQNGTLELDAAGVYVFGSLEIQSTASGDSLIANNVNGPASITVEGALTFNIDGLGDIIVNDTGVDPWILSGGIVDEVSGGGGGTVFWGGIDKFARRKYQPAGIGSGGGL